MLTNLSLDLGTPRSVAGHFVSGGIAASIISGALNYQKYKKEEITQSEMMRDTLKISLQGAIASASAVATTNYIGESKIVEAMTALSIGAIGVYGTQKVYDRLEVQVNKNKELENAK